VGTGSGRPQGTITRGTTNPNRLRRFDRWIVHRMGPALRAHPSPTVVDLGYGASAITTVELADRVARVRPSVEVVGIEIDPDRVASAAALARPGVHFSRGGFEVPLPGGRRPLVIRAANVLRQYDESEVAAAWASMVDRLELGGLLVEGTCDELGRLASWVAVPARAPGTTAAGPGGPPVPETLTLSVDLRTLERPSQVAERLPKALIHRNVAGQGVHELLAVLDRAWDRAAPHGVFGPRQRWLAALEQVRAEGLPLHDGRARWRLGEVTVPWSVVAPR
jgi:hypothetical protein